MKTTPEKKSAQDEVKRIFDLAKSFVSKDISKSMLYVTKARRLAMHHRMKLSRNYKGKFCKKCNTYFVPGKTVRVRTKEGKIVYTCLNCRKVRRFV